MSRPLRAEERALRSALLELAALEGRGPEYEYRGPADFVAREGRFYTPIVGTFTAGAPRMCFGNAINLAAFSSARGLPFGYVEGYATSDLAGGMPVHHAWVTFNGVHAIDVTWGVFTDAGRQVAVVPRAAYLGVEFCLERADAATWDGDATVLDDYRRGWPILREPWAGEDPDLEWPPSKRLEAIRRAALGDDLGAQELLAELDVEAFGTSRRPSR